MLMLPTSGAATATVVTSVDDLERHAAAIEGLAQHAVDPNPYYEPWFMLPLLRAFGDSQRLRFLLIHGGGDLIGFFPFELRPLRHRLPVPCLRMWRDPHWWAFRSTPLVRDGAMAACLDALGRWLRSDWDGPPLADFINLPGNAAFAVALREALARNNGQWCDLTWQRESHLICRQDTLDTYLAAILNGDKRRNLQRRQRRLAELGPLTYTDASGDPGLIEEFLDLEVKGWKGRMGTAIAGCPKRRAVAAEILRGAQARGRLSLLALRVGGRLVAARSVLLAPPGGFGFKIAYDETPEIARCSPSYLLELEALRRLHAEARLDWLDTCADPDAELARAVRWQPLPVLRLLISPRRHPAALALAVLAWRQKRGAR